MDPLPAKEEEIPTHLLNDGLSLLSSDLSEL